MIAVLARWWLLALSRLPRGMSQTIGRLIGRWHFLANSRAARVTRVNLELCLPELDASTRDNLVRRSLIETGKTMMETPAVWLGNLDQVDRWIDRVTGEDVLLDALDKSKGVLILLSHVGNWELFNVYFRRHGLMTALYQPPRKKSLAGLMVEVRAQHGNEMVPTTRGGLARLYKTLRSGGNVVVLPDQVPATGRYLPFFGQDALTDELSGRLLGKTGATAVGACVLRENDGGFNLVFVRPDDAIYSADLDESLKAVNALVEKCARMSLAQYQWEYKRFRERPAGQSKIYRFDKPPGVH